MEKNLTRKEVEARLRAKSEAIREQYHALQDEVSESGHTIMDRLKEQPIFGILGSLLAGLVVGLLLGGVGKGKRRTTRSRERLLGHALEQSQRLRKQQGGANGGEPSDGKVEPISIVFLPEEEKSTSVWRSLMWFGLNMALRQGLVKAQSFLADRFEGGEGGPPGPASDQMPVAGPVPPDAD